MAQIWKLTAQTAWIATAMICILAAVPGVASAGIFVLQDDNSTATIDTTTQDGVMDWTVGGTDHLFQQWFWFRIGANPEASIDTLPIDAEGTLDTDFDTFDDTLFVRYLNGDIEIEARFVLDGGTGGSGSAQLSEQITVRNVGNEKQNFHLFQYSDFDMGASELNDQLVFNNVNANRHFDGVGSGIAVDTTVNRAPNRYEGGVFPDTLNKLNDGVADSLDNLPAIGTLMTPDDVTYAYQWDFMLAPGDSFQVGIDKNITSDNPEPIIPEPTSLTLALLCLAGVAGATRRRR